jgi:hypothetical protein
MMKINSMHAWLLTAAAMMIAALPCAGDPKTPMRNNVAVKKTAFGSPSDSVLLYGSAVQPKTLGTMLSSKKINNLEMIQLNPAKEPMLITPARIGDYFFTEPLPLGLSVRFYYFTIKDGLETVPVNVGIQGQGPTDKRLEKPGLLYLGSLVFCDKAYAEKKTLLGPLDINTMSLYPIGDDLEIDILSSMNKAFKDTEWEAVIAARIEELKQ